MGSHSSLSMTSPYLWDLVLFTQDFKFLGEKYPTLPWKVDLCLFPSAVNHQGIFVSSPQMCYGVHFRKGILIGETTKSEQELKKILVDMM